MLLFAIGLATQAGCSTTSECDAIVAVPPVINIVDAATGQAICDATVIAQCDDPDAGTALPPFGANGYEVDAAVLGCHYGSNLQPVCIHAYTVYVSKMGYKSVSVADVEVRSSMHCPGPIPTAQQVNVMLEPS